MVNRGVEITLSGEIIRQKDFSWNASLLYAFNRNKVKTHQCATKFVG